MEKEAGQQFFRVSNEEKPTVYITERDECKRMRKVSHAAILEFLEVIFGTRTCVYGKGLVLSLGRDGLTIGGLASRSLCSLTCGLEEYRWMKKQRKLSGEIVAGRMVDDALLIAKSVCVSCLQSQTRKMHSIRKWTCEGTIRDGVGQLTWTSVKVEDIKGKLKFTPKEDWIDVIVGLQEVDQTPVFFEDTYSQNFYRGHFLSLASRLEMTVVEGGDIRLMTEVIRFILAGHPINRLVGCMITLMNNKAESVWVELCHAQKFYKNHSTRCATNSTRK